MSYKAAPIIYTSTVYIVDVYKPQDPEPVTFVVDKLNYAETILQETFPRKKKIVAEKFNDIITAGNTKDIIPGKKYVCIRKIQMNSFSSIYTKE